LKEIANIYKMQGKDTSDLEQQIAELSKRGSKVIREPRLMDQRNFIENSGSVYFEKGSSMTFDG